MKIVNPFKKVKASDKKATVEKLETKQMSAVAGGTDDSTQDGRWQASGIGHAIVIKS